MDFEAAYAILTQSPSFQSQTTPILGSPQPVLPLMASQLQQPVPIIPHNEDHFQNFFTDDNIQSSKNPNNAAHLPHLTPTKTPYINSPPHMVVPQLTAAATTAASSTSTSASSAMPFNMVSDAHHDLLFKSNTPPPLPLPTTPDLGSHQQQKVPSPMDALLDIESLAYFSKHDELLSVNETNALEQFLDSIIDDRKTISDGLVQQQAQKLHTHHPAYSTEKVRDFDNAYNEAIHKMEEITGRPRSNEREDETRPKMGLGSPLLANFEAKLLHDDHKTNFSSVAGPLPTQNVKYMKDQENHGQKPRKKRKVLSEEQKKLNHTTSEQKRRIAIKEAFDDLVKLLPSLNEREEGSVSKRKNQPKSIVLERTVSDIEMLINVNNELKKLLKE
jgi:hypothetical protein